MNKKKIGILTGVCVCILGISLPTIALAETSSRRANIKSTGNIDFEDGEVYIASSDLTYLADEIDNLEDIYKTTTVNALNDIGTFFLSDGTTVNDITQNEADTDEEKAALSFGKITEGIRNSQSVESLHQVQAVDKDGNLLFYETEEAQTNKDLFSLTTTDTGFPAYYQAANANNLSAGTAAWVDGTLIKGNGSDNAAYYAQGWTDGMANVTDNLNIQYTYHVHEGSSDDGSGCYTIPVYHTHIDSCYDTTQTGTVYRKNVYPIDELGQWRDHYYCSNCGALVGAMDEDGLKFGYTSGTHNCKILICIKESGTTIDYYSPSCGKSETTIESALIIW